MIKLLLIKLFVFGFLLCNAQQRIMFLNKSVYTSSKKIDFYRYPKEVKCEFKNGTKKRLILEKLVDDSLIFRKYYNQEIFDCIMDSVKSLYIYEKKSIDQVLTLPRKVKCVFKDGSKQNLILEKMNGDSLFFKKVQGVTKKISFSINDIKKIKVNIKDNSSLYGIGIFSALSFYMSYETYHLINQVTKGEVNGFPPSFIFIAMSPLTIGTAIVSLVSIKNFRKNYSFKKWQIYAL